MEFIEFNLETALSYLNQLNQDSKPVWGTMSAQRMVEHLSDALRMSVGDKPYQLAIPEDKIESMKRFLASDKPMAKNVAVNFAPEDAELRNEELELAIDEFIDTWLSYDEYYSVNPGSKHLHPYYGELNSSEWVQLHRKHFTHHFEQFNLIKKGEQ